MEPPWDRLEPEEQAMIEAYCAEFERAVTGSGDSVTFLERAALVDQRCTEAWFANDFGSAHADPMQAFRQLPTGGVVHPVIMLGRTTRLGAPYARRGTDGLCPLLHRVCAYTAGCGEEDGGGGGGGGGGPKWHCDC